jgi:hypothetical protein
MAGLTARIRRADDRVAPAQTVGRVGVWEQICRAALAVLDVQGKRDWSMSYLDGSFVPAKKGGEHDGLTKKGKGTKWMLFVGVNGLP